jgi:hypothetical protein
VFGNRNLLILKSAESLKSPEATSSGRKWAQIDEFSFFQVSLRLILAGFETKFERGFANIYRRCTNPSIYAACARLPRGFGPTLVRRLFARVAPREECESAFTDHRHFDHDYAVTNHGSQGLTSERVLVHADTGVHPDLLNSRFGYVLVPRASHEVTIFTKFAKLGQQLGTEINKSSALDLVQNQPVNQDIGLVQ